MKRDEVLGEIRARSMPTMRVFDAVSALYTERDVLRDAREVLKRECEALKSERDALTERLKAVEAENERLRTLLTEADDELESFNDSFGLSGMRDTELSERIDATLNATTGEQK